MEYYINIILILFSIIFQTKTDIIFLPFGIKEIPEKRKYQFIYTPFEIGDPPQKVEGEMNFINSTFFMAFNGKNKLIPTNNKYVPADSKSFILDSKNIKIKESLLGLAKENFYFYTDMSGHNKKMYENINVLVPNFDTYENITLLPVLGLQIEKENKTFNFINVLKSKNIINNYYWTLKFHDLNNGTIIIGDLPHNYNKSNYKEANLVLVNTYSATNKLYWGIHIACIKFYGITINDNNIGKIDPQILEIIGSYEYITTIEKIFFQKYIDDFICRRIWDEINGDDIFRFICEKDKFNDSDIEEFPPIQIVNTEMNYTFEFKGRELFQEKGDHISFQIVAKAGRTDDEWILGRIFLYKYQIIYNNDNNLIGMYMGENDEYRKKENNPKNSSNIYLILIIVLIVIFFIIGAILLYMFINEKWIFKGKKKRLPEIDDDFEYIPEDNNNINNVM